MLVPRTSRSLSLFYVRVPSDPLANSDRKLLYDGAGVTVTFNARRGQREIRRRTNYAANPTAKCPKDQPCPPDSRTSRQSTPSNKEITHSVFSYVMYGAVERMHR